MKITLDQLKQWGICDPDRYAEYIGDGIELTPEAIIAADAADLLDPNWLAPRVLTSEKLAAYNAKEATALAVFNTVFTPAMRAEYNRLSDALQDAENNYRAATVQALVEEVKERVDADNLSLSELADEAECEFDAGKTLPIEKLCQPTREQKCADLARAMGWTLVHDGYGLSPEYPAVPQPRKMPNPYESAEDSRMMVAWLAKQPKSVKSKFSQLLAQFIVFSWEFEGENGTCTLWDHLQDGTLFEDHFVDLLTAPLPIIADAAWQAIQGK